MQSISIGTIRYVEQFRKKLVDQIAILAEEGIGVEISESGSGDYAFFHFDTIDKQADNEQFSGLSHYAFTYYIANLFSEVIIDDLETILMEKILADNYEYFLAEDKQNILNNASKSLRLGTIGTEKTILHQLERKKKVFHRILDYLDDNNRLVIEGFLRFRLRDYYSELEEVVNQAVENHIMEKEYREFIRLLKYFVEMQEPRVDEVHVIWSSNKNFQILNADGQIINNELLEDFALDILDEGIDQGDLLVSTLITISPLRIVLHSKEQREIMETIKSIFSTRVMICPGCNLCGSVESAQEENIPQLLTSTMHYIGGKEKS